MNNLIAPGIDVDSLSVLIVDDVPLNILLIKKMLSRYTFEIRTANGGQAALERGGRVGIIAVSARILAQRQRYALLGRRKIVGVPTVFK